jgi:hypothetical protein
MNVIDKERFIRQKATENYQTTKADKIYWSRHATSELVNDSLNRTEVETGLAFAVVIEDYPSVHRPLPDCLVLLTLPDGDPIHAVIAVDKENDRIYIVTVYRPNAERWENDWRTRK